MRESESRRTQTPFSRLTGLCRALRATSSTIKKQELISMFLLSLKEEEVEPAILLLSGRVMPETDQKDLGVGYETIRKAFNGKKYRRLMERHREATLQEVYVGLRKISEVTGKDSTSRKRRILLGIYNSIEEEDKEILTGMIMGELRVGAVEGLILGGIAKASDISLKEVREAYMLSGEMGKIARIAIHKGREEVRSIKIEPFNPLRPMLATSVDTLEEAFGTRDNVAVEVKYDGARVQIHLRDGTVKIFSRRLTEVTKSLPDVVEMVKSKVYTQEAVLEGEVVGIDSRGKPLPFQYLMRRFRRILRIEEAVKKIPIELHLFDILYINGEMLIHKPYSERYLTLEKVADIQVLTERLVTEDIREAKALYQRAIEMGHEGVMVKNLESPYILGRRGKHWLKVKKVGTLDLVIIGADWGHGRRRGWLSDYYLSAYIPDTDEFEIIGKTFKGLTDQEFRSITQQLLSLKTYEKDYTVWVRPQIVVEVAFNEIQKSPTYPCGYALRLARIVRFREDKTPSEADSIQKVAELYEKQFKYKGKAEF